MTDQEFKTWDRHKAENLASQVVDSLKRIEALETEKAKLADEHKKASNALRAKIADLEAQIATLQQDLEKARADCKNMVGHPDVIAANEKARAALKAKLTAQLAELDSPILP